MPHQDKISHLGFIQGVINRMGNNSFLIKGWSITLTTALLALLKDSENLYIAIIPILFFWWLDAFFLHQERLYRELYNDISKNENFSPPFSMNPQKYAPHIPNLWKTLQTKTLFGFYGSLLIMICLINILK